MPQLLDFTSSGIYCPVADVYIDPWKPVEKAIISHAHADHARMGHMRYITHARTIPLLKHNLGEYINVEGLEYDESIDLNGVKISLHPAGHIFGSAQIRLEYDGEVWVVSGDFKLEDDGLSKPFEPLKCDVFVTEATFGLPLFQWKPQAEVFDEINDWWRTNSALGKASILIGYNLGKAQRLMCNLNPNIGEIFVHPSIENVNKILRRSNYDIPEFSRFDAVHSQDDYEGSLVLAPSSLLNSPKLKEIDSYSIAIASGWMSLKRAQRHHHKIDKGFILSDHADWNQLKTAVAATGAKKVYITNEGYSASFYRWLRDGGYDVHVVPTKFEGELNEMRESLYS